MKKIDIIAVAEDGLAEAVVLRLLDEIESVRVHQTFVKGGVGNISKNIKTFCSASKIIPHVVLADLDRNRCVSGLFSAWRFEPADHPRLLLRIAVKEVEAWLLADVDGIARFLAISPRKIAARPETLADPKVVLVSLAKRSRLRHIKEGLAPSPGSGATVGPLYNAFLRRFCAEEWDVEAASLSAPSLAKARLRLQQFGASLKF